VAVVASELTADGPRYTTVAVRALAGRPDDRVGDR